MNCPMRSPVAEWAREDFRSLPQPSREVWHQLKHDEAFRWFIGQIQDGIVTLEFTILEGLAENYKASTLALESFRTSLCIEPKYKEEEKEDE